MTNWGVIGLIIGIGYGLLSGGYPAVDSNVVTPHVDNMYYVGADGNQIILINNPNATDPTYGQLLSFLDDDVTDDNEYDNKNYTCGDFAEDVHNNAELAGYRAGWVAIDLYASEGHACNAFNTIDRGIVYIDCTESDKKVNLVIGEEYIPDRIHGGNVEYMSMGTVRNFETYW